MKTLRDVKPLNSHPTASAPGGPFSVPGHVINGIPVVPRGRVGVIVTAPPENQKVLGHTRALLRKCASFCLRPGSPKCAPIHQVCRLIGSAFDGSVHSDVPSVPRNSAKFVQCIQTFEGKNIHRDNPNDPSVSILQYGRFAARRRLEGREARCGTSVV
jgi:hypothetical protein